MFQFTTTTVINTNKDYTTGLDLWKFEAEADGKPASLNIKRHLNFKKPNVVSITKAEYTPSKLAKAKLKLPSLGSTEGTYRIAMYIKLSQSSANSYYANDLVFKGKPLYIEFVWKAGETAATVAKKVKDIAKKYMLMVYEKDLVKIDIASDDTTTLVITGTDEYQRFTRVDIEQFVEGPSPTYGFYAVLKSALTEDQKTIDGVANPDYDENFTIEQGEEGFGTYQWILKNLRLPTAARTSWTAINADEVPIIGAQYDEYVVRYCVNRGIMGGDAVGEVTKSLTTHVFYVNKNVSSAFETELAKIAPEGGIETVPAEPEVME